MCFLGSHRFLFAQMDRALNGMHFKTFYVDLIIFALFLLHF